MQITINEDVLKRLEALAHQQNRVVEALVEEALEQYVHSQPDREAFRTVVQRHIQEHAWLLDELAKQ